MATDFKADSHANAQIISYNLYGETVCASAARISTTRGDALEIFQNASDREKNQNLIRKVLASGHASVIEHMTFTIALRNVSVFIEEFFIEHRLASYTVKSRRYVDYSQQGYYIPADLSKDARNLYQSYMNPLFDAYHALLNLNIPKEDARFLLPYAFHSNFYCTLNARELIHIIQAARHGKYHNPPELQAIADQLETQLNSLFPFLQARKFPRLFDENPARENAETKSIQYHYNYPVFLTEQEAGLVSVLQSPAQPDQILKAAYQIANPGAINKTTRPGETANPGEHDKISDPDWREFIKSQLQSTSQYSRARELEQLAYTFRIQDITLSGVTHLVRHRMQSPVIPPIPSVSLDRFILPESVQSNPDAAKIYQTSIENAANIRARAFEIPEFEHYRAYFALSGNLVNVMTTMNARELEVFIRLRTCQRAQWEIRHIAVRALDLLRRNFPDLFHLYGPACYTTGVCPEGRLTCGQAREVIARFQP